MVYCIVPNKQSSYSTNGYKILLKMRVLNQRTNGPVNTHLISEPTISKHISFAKLDFVVK